MSFRKDDLKLIAKSDPVAAVEQANQEVKKKGTHALMSKRKFQPQDRAAQVAALREDRKLRIKAQESSLPFIDGDAFQDFRLVQGLYLLGGGPGRGKSTTAANVLAGVADELKGKKAYVISNEEMSDAVLGRVACIQLRKPYNKYHKRKLPRHEMQEVDDHCELLLDRIYVVNDPAYDMSCIEDVQAVLEYAKDTGDVGMVLIDYYQTIEISREHPEMESFRVLKKLGSYLKDYGRKVDVPVVAFAQLNPEGADFEARVQNDKTVYNHSFAAVEIKPDFDTGRTTFIIRKDRFGEVQGREIEMEFVNGRFEAVGGGAL